MEVRLNNDTLESLPLEIELVGFSLNRVVFLDDCHLTCAYKQITDSKGKVFSWGIVSEQSRLLGFAILNTFMSPQEALYLFNTFTHHFIAWITDKEIEGISKVPNSTGNFKITIELRAWYEAIMTSTVPANRDWFKAYARQVEIEIPEEQLKGDMTALNVERVNRGRGLLNDDIVISPMTNEQLEADRPKLEE